MATSIIEELAYGNITPETQSYRRNSEYGKAMQDVSNAEEKLLKLLSGDEKIIFEKYLVAQGRVNQLTAVNNLVYGYKLGLRMTAEAFLLDDDLLT